MAAKIKHSKLSRSDLGQTDAVGAAIDYGIDVSMLTENLKRSPTERIRRHQIALNTALALRKAKKAMQHPRDREAILQLEAIKKLKKQRTNRQ